MSLSITSRKWRGHSLSDHLKSPVSIIRPSIGDSWTLFTKMVTLGPNHPHSLILIFIDNENNNNNNRDALHKDVTLFLYGSSSFSSLFILISSPREYKNGNQVKLNSVTVLWYDWLRRQNWPIRRPAINVMLTMMIAMTVGLSPNYDACAWWYHLPLPANTELGVLHGVVICNEYWIGAKMVRVHLYRVHPVHSVPSAFRRDKISHSADSKKDTKEVVIYIDKGVNLLYSYTSQF